MDDNTAQTETQLAQALGRQIAAERTAAGLSQRDLAQRAGISPEAVYRYENARRDIPLAALSAIAKALDLKPSDMLSAAERRADRLAAGVERRAEEDRRLDSESPA